MNTKQIAITFILASSVVRPIAAQYQYDAEQCRFEATQTTYGYSNRVLGAGPLYIEWSPVTGEIFKYEWYLDISGAAGSNPDDHTLYSEYQGAPNAHMSGKTADRSSLLLDAQLTSHYSGVRNNFIHARLFNGYGSYPEWNFAGILEQTGSSWIGAGRKVTCGDLDER